MQKVLNMAGREQITFVWMHEEQRCPYICYVDPKLVKGYSDYCLVDQDLRSARECFEILSRGKIENDVVAHSLLSNGAVTYGRSFTEADARNVILDPNQVFAKSTVHRTYHDWIMKLRHKLFAHAGGSEYESIMVYLALHPDKVSGPLEVYRGLVKVSSFGVEESVAAVAAIDFTLDWVKIKIDEAYLRMKEMLWKIDKNELYKIAQYPETLDSKITQIVTNKRA